jgi:membrane-bound lytic murein transglycosylase D
MHTKWASFCLGLALALGGARQVRASDDAGKTPKEGSANAPVKAKPRPKAPSKSGKVQTRAPGPPKAPNEAVRKAVSGTSNGADEVESPELLAIREADRELFPQPEPAGGRKGGPPAGIPWPNDLPLPITLDPSQPVVRASGFPPSPLLSEPASGDAGRDLGWLRALAMPEVPVRWDTRVIRYLDYYRDDPRGRNLTQTWIRRSGRYGATIRRTLREQGLPEDLLWVSLVESGFDPAIRSPAGAAGLWQLMPDGARVYGLVVDRWIDERLDPERSTQAAARYLFDLHRRFGAWELALAAYNMGYGGLLAAIRKYNTNDYWELSRVEAGIPYETALYVPKIIAVAVVAKNYGTFGVDASKVDPPVAFEQVGVPSGVTIKAIAAAAGVESAVIEGLNPQLRAGRTPPEAPSSDVVTWTVRVPPGKGATVSQSLPQAGAQDRKLDRYLTRLGDSVESIAAARGISKARLLDTNALRTDEVVRAGTVLLLPPPDPSKSPVLAKTDDKPVIVVPTDVAQLAGRKRVFYRVIAGDTLPEIAAAFRVTADDLRRWNALDPSARLHEGMTMQVFAPESADLSKVVCMTEGDVRCLTVGSEEFFAHFEGLRGRKRTTLVVEEGDTWEKIGKRYNLTPGQLERINQRSRTDKLAPKEMIIVYAPAAQPIAKPSGGPTVPAAVAPLAPPNPEDLPGLPGAKAAESKTP